MNNLEFNGSINLILGNMFSGKTSELIRRYRRHKISGKSCIIIKYKFDTRYDDSMIVSHDNIKVDAVACINLIEVDEIIKKYDVICIDEVQFYKDAHIFCDKWANQGKIIEASGLSGTFNRTPFEVISKLVAKAETCIMLNAILAGTNNNAPFTKLIVDNKDGGTELIGGADKYTPVDRKTFFDNNSEKYCDILLKEMVEFYKCQSNDSIENLKEVIKNDSFNLYMKN
jgi:thymidine kinase